MWNAARAKDAYEIGVTNALKTAAEAFAGGRRVCLDHAHIIMAQRCRSAFRPVMAADTRANAGVDNIGNFKKLYTWSKPGDRVFVLLKVLRTAFVKTNALDI